VHKSCDELLMNISKNVTHFACYVLTFMLVSWSVSGLRG